MRDTLTEMAAKYRADHQHPVNRALHLVGVPLIILSAPLLIVDWRLALTAFVLGWVLQLIGHAVEGKPPSFVGDPRFLARVSRGLLGRNSD